MATERQNFRSRARVLLVEIKEAGKIVYRPLTLNETTNKVIANFFSEENTKLTNRLKELRTLPSNRCKREIRDIKKNRGQIICKEQLKEKISVLKGARLQPIKLVFKKGKLNGFELTSFVNEEQKGWWTYIKQENKMGKIAEIADMYPSGPELLAELFDIRYRMKYGSSKELDQVAKDYEAFTLKAKDIPLELDVLFVPLFKMITEKFTT